MEFQGLARCEKRPAKWRDSAPLEAPIFCVFSPTLLARFPRRKRSRRVQIGRVGWENRLANRRRRRSCPRPAKRGEGSRLHQQSRAGEGRDKLPLTPTLSPLRGAREHTEIAACESRLPRPRLCSFHLSRHHLEHLRLAFDLREDRAIAPAHPGFPPPPP